MTPTEPDDEHEETAFREPLPPDDRLWRHPSELSTDLEAPRRSIWARLRHPDGSSER